MENKNPVEKSNRIVAIDVLRGFALLGILGANIMFFDVEASYLKAVSYTHLTLPTKRIV